MAPIAWAQQEAIEDEDVHIDQAADQAELQKIISQHQQQQEQQQQNLPVPEGQEQTPATMSSEQLQSTLSNLDEKQVYADIEKKLQEKPYTKFLTNFPKLIKFFIKLVKDPIVFKQAMSVTQQKDKFKGYTQTSFFIGATIFVLSFLIGRGAGFFKKIFLKGFFFIFFVLSQMGNFFYHFPQLAKAVIRVGRNFF